MLLPALGKARSKAIAVSCQSNLKQMGLVLYSYMDDYEGWLPPPVTTFSPVRIWTTELYNGNYIRYSINNNVQQQQSTLATCPMPGIKYRGTYGLRVNGQQVPNCGIRISDKPIYKFLGATVKTWKSATEMILLGDTAQLGDPTRQNYRLDDNNSGQAAGGIPHYRHDGRCNILYGDGHVEAVAEGKLADSVRAAGSWTWYTKSNVMAGAYPSN